jgi:beta-ketoacyl-acyl-carrier-protein synthase II
MGIWSCIGENLEEVKQSLYEGRSGIGIDPARKELGYRSALTGIVREPELKGKVDRRQRHCLSQQGRYAYAATEQALAQAGIDKDFLLENEVGILYGNDSSAEAVINGIDVIREKKNTLLVGSGNIFQSMNSTITMNLSTIFNLRGVNFTISGACASGSHAIGMAYLLIKSGLQECMICGGAEASISKLGIAGFCAEKAMSTRNDDPLHASRPFDKDRDGFVMSEGSGVLILEELEHAKRRGATILAEVVGYGLSGDGYHITSPAPDGNGGARAMRMALRHAGLKPEELDYLNAHGTSTELNDKFETLAIKGALGEAAKKVAVSSTKGVTGHGLGAAGGFESIVCVQSIVNNVVPPTINYETPDPDCDLDVTPNTAREMEVKVALNSNLGFGGHNGALLFSKFEG